MRSPRLPFILTLLLLAGNILLLTIVLPAFQFAASSGNFLSLRQKLHALAAEGILTVDGDRLRQAEDQDGGPADRDDLSRLAWQVTEESTSMNWLYAVLIAQTGVLAWLAFVAYLNRRDEHGVRSANPPQ